MPRVLPRLAGFAGLACVYTIVLLAVASLIPFLFLIGLLVWLIWRRPITHAGRVDADARALGDALAQVAAKAIRGLVWPLVR